MEAECNHTSTPPIRFHDGNRDNFTSLLYRPAHTELLRGTECEQNVRIVNHFMRFTDMDIYEHQNQTNIRGKSKETSKCVTKLYKMYDYVYILYLPFLRHGSTTRQLHELHYAAASTLNCWWQNVIVQDWWCQDWYKSRDWNVHTSIRSLCIILPSRNTQYQRHCTHLASAL